MPAIDLLLGPDKLLSDRPNITSRPPELTQSHEHTNNITNPLLQSYHYSRPIQPINIIVEYAGPPEQCQFIVEYIGLTSTNFDTNPIEH